VEMQRFFRRLPFLSLNNYRAISTTSLKLQEARKDVAVTSPHRRRRRDNLTSWVDRSFDRGVDRVADRFLSDFRDLFSFPSLVPALASRLDTDLDTWVPVIDVSETDKEIIVACELPGVQPASIRLRIENGVLKISGERKEERSKELEDVVVVERSYGKFYREINLPENIDAQGIKAEMKDGVLRVVIPKKEQQQKGKEIPVSSPSEKEPTSSATSGSTTSGSTTSGSTTSGSTASGSTSKS